MNFNEFDKKIFQNDIKKLIEEKEDFCASDDCYCVLMKQIFLSKSTLN